MMSYVLCGKPAAYRFTWPGQDEAFICEEHMPKLKMVAGAMGFQLQIVPLPPLGPGLEPTPGVETAIDHNPVCSQKVTADPRPRVEALDGRDTVYVEWREEGTDE
jgi:hypothetical protein